MNNYELLDGYDGGENEKEKIYEALNMPRNTTQLASEEDFSRNVAMLLLGMGLEKYIELFQSENIGLEVLTAMTADDLRAIGVENEQDIADIQDKFGCVQSMEEVVLQPSDDTAIVKSMVEQTRKLGSVFFQLALKLQKIEKKLVDKPLSSKYSQLEVLNAVLEQTIAQTETNLRLVYADNKTGLVYDIIEKDKLTFPIFLKKKLTKKRKIKKSVLIMLTTICVVCFGVAFKRFI